MKQSFGSDTFTQETSVELPAQGSSTADFFSNIFQTAEKTVVSQIPSLINKGIASVTGTPVVSTIPKATTISAVETVKVLGVPVGVLVVGLLAYFYFKKKR